MFVDQGETMIVLERWSSIVAIPAKLAPQFALGGLVINDDREDH